MLGFANPHGVCSFATVQSRRKDRTSQSPAEGNPQPGHKYPDGIARVENHSIGGLPTPEQEYMYPREDHRLRTFELPATRLSCL